MFLYQLPRTDDGTKIYGLKGMDDKDLVVKFYHIDGMYSYCVAYTMEGEKLGAVHLKASTPLVEYEDGYKIEE